jgi:pyruvate dehydrogenase (quinone)
MFKDVVGAFVQHASTPGRRGDLVDRAVRIALGERPVTAIVLPNDPRDMTYERRRSTEMCTRVRQGD